MSYIMGFLTPVEKDRQDEYTKACRDAWPLFKEYGALHYMEAWSDHVPEGKITDFPRAVKLKENESVCFSWITWPDKVTHDKCDAAFATDERFKALSMPFDGSRMVIGGFNSIFEAHG